MSILWKAFLSLRMNQFYGFASKALDLSLTDVRLTRKYAACEETPLKNPIPSTGDARKAASPELDTPYSSCTRMTDH